MMWKISVLLVFLVYITIAQAQECNEPVGENMKLKDPPSSFPDGTTVTFACIVGYQSAGGSPSITCTAGTWSPIKLKCERKNCGSAGEILNGQTNYPEETLFGDKVIYTCNTGYVMIGTKERICGDQGWMGREPTCEAVSCDPPTANANSEYSPIKDNYGYNQQVRYICKDDLALIGSPVSTCIETGFDTEPPTCIAVSCPDDDVANGEQVSGSRPPHRYKAIVTFKCLSGYVMEGVATQVCGLDSKWSPGLPKCKLSSTIAATTTPTTPTTPPADKTMSPTTTPQPDSGNNLFIKIGIPILVIGVLVAGVSWFIMKKKKRKHHSVVGPVLPDLKKEFKGMSQNADTCGQNGQMLFRDSGTS
ncbi:membrane cofactor protein isoform X2 [Cynoglossus semilaevis]|uniref:membrane cofactor protein isoform X2 n=1 Tax=Cynoglossus semilaevis TaxID=244447 RepID=UPI00049683CF|nr:membrane cofactor protein isoform X2 [Cynoglossus semilaevis]